MRDFNEASGVVDNEKTKPTHRVVIRLSTGEQLTICLTKDSKYNGKISNAIIGTANSGKDLTALLKVAIVSSTCEVLNGTKASSKSTPEVEAQLLALLSQ